MTLTISWAVWPQILVGTLMVLRLLLNAAKHGEPINQEYSIVTALISAAIWVWVLHEGGFW